MNKIIICNTKKLQNKINQKRTIYLSIYNKLIINIAYINNRNKKKSKR